MIKRHDVTPRDEGAVKRAHGIGEVVVGSRNEHGFDASIDGFRSHGGIIEGALAISRRRGPAIGQLVARRGTARPVELDHVEFEALHAPPELHLVDAPHSGRDTDPGQRGGIVQGEPLLVLRGRHDLEIERLSFPHGLHLARSGCKARRLEQRKGFLVERAISPRPVAHRRSPTSVEHIGRDDVAIGREEGHLSRRCLSSDGRKVRTVEEACRPSVRSKEQIGVHPFEIEEQGQGLPHALVRKDLATRIEDEAVHAGGQANRNGFLDDPARLHGRKVVTLNPAGRLVLEAQVDQACPEGLEKGVRVPIEFVADLVDIVEAGERRKILGPKIRVPAKDNARSRLHLGDDIGAGAELRLEGRAREFRRIRGVARQNGKEREAERCLAIERATQIEGHGARADDPHAAHLRRNGTEEGTPLGFQQLEAERNVFGGDGHRVGKASFRRKLECHEVAFGAELDAAGEQPIQAERLIMRPEHQTLENEARHRVRSIAADDQRVQAIERALHTEDEPPAASRRGVGVGKMSKAFGEGRLTMHGNRVSRCRNIGGSRNPFSREQGSNAGARAKRKDTPVHGGNAQWNGRAHAGSQLVSLFGSDVRLGRSAIGTNPRKRGGITMIRKFHVRNAITGASRLPGRCQNSGAGKCATKAIIRLGVMLPPHSKSMRAAA